jgi:uncharacterized membrane protein YfcA
VGTVPVALVAAYFATQLSPTFIRIAMLALTTFAVLRAAGVVRVAPHPKLFVPLSALIGVLASGTGVGGFLAAPLLVALGLSGAPYVATAAACSVVLHASRMVGYGAGGLLSSRHLTASFVLFAGLIAGNLAGRTFRRTMPKTLESRLELGALVLCTVLGVFGIGGR